MKKTVRILCLILSALMILSALPLTASGAEIVDSGNCGADGDNISWVLTDDGALTISGKGEMEAYGYWDYEAPWKYYDFSTAVISDGVTSIGYYAFYDCSSLTSITIPDSVTEIGCYAFEYCPSLEEITVDENNPVYHSSANCLIETDSKKLIVGCKNSVIPTDGSVTTIGDHAFYGYSSLTSIIFPDSVTSIGNAAFCGCSSLASVAIPDSVTSIGDDAFYGCSSLTSITIPGSVTKIGYSAFYDCSSLTSITIQDGVTEIGNYAFEYCSSLTSVIIPDGVTDISYCAFRSCSSLTSVTIPDSVTEIDNSAFEYCPSLEEITVGENNPVYHSSGNCLIETYSKTLIFGLKNSVIPTDGSVTSIDYSAFSGCSALTSVNIPDSVTSIGDYAFYDCSSLTSVTIPDSVTEIGDYAFYNCPSLEEITVGENNPVYHSSGNSLIETDSKKLIAGCKNSVIPTDGSVTSIGYSAFAFCSSLTSITIPDSVTSIGYSAFEYCSSLTSITIPDSVTEIDDYAFDRCDALKDVYYLGSEDGWNGISVGYSNDALQNATVHFHAWDSGVVTVPATCSHEGEITYTCTDCGATKTKTISKTKHTDNNKDDICDVCGGRLDFYYSLEATDVKAGKFTLSVIAHNVEGQNTFNPTVYYNSDVISAFYADSSSWIDEFRRVYYYWDVLGAYNYGNPGEVIAGIAIGDKFYSDEKWAELCAEHGFIPTIRTEAVTLFTVEFSVNNPEAEDITITCEGAEITVHVKCSHKNTAFYDETKQTCTENGYTAGTYCLDCGEWISGHEIIQPSHNYDDGKITKTATCKEMGIKTFTCTVCRATKTETIAKLTTHTYDNGKVTKAATINEPGVKTYTCTVCGATKTETIAKLTVETASDKETGISVTYVENAYADKITLQVEKKSDTADYQVSDFTKVTAYDITTLVNGKAAQPGTAVTVTIPLPDGYDEKTTAVYHVEKDGAKTKVGAEIKNGVITITANGFSVYLIIDESSKIQAVPGDVDGDGNITVSDARLALRQAIELENYAVGSKEYFACNVDRDEAVTVNDARSILRVAIQLDDKSVWDKK